MRSEPGGAVGAAGENRPQSRDTRTSLCIELGEKKRKSKEPSDSERRREEEEEDDVYQSSVSFSSLLPGKRVAS